MCVCVFECVCVCVCVCVCPFLTIKSLLPQSSGEITSIRNSIGYAIECKLILTRLNNSDTREIWYEKTLTYKCVYMYIHILIYDCGSIYIYIYIYVYTCIYMRVCTVEVIGDMRWSTAVLKHPNPKYWPITSTTSSPPPTPWFHSFTAIPQMGSGGVTPRGNPSPPQYKNNRKI